MKAIDLLNKMANKEEMPQKIKYSNKIYEWKEYDCGYQEKKKVNWVKKWGYVAEVDRTYYYLEHCFKDLNDEIEIIEEDDKIEKIGNDYYHKTQPEQNQIFQRKINQIIDVINEMKNEN